jgi:lipoprotein-anchoring transpeptidase ErfK/SrfK
VSDVVKRWVRVAASIAALALAVGCQAASGDQDSTAGGRVVPSASASPPAPTPATRITVMPSDGAKAVAPDTKVVVTAAGGTLKSVVAKNAAGRRLEGEYTADKATWRATGDLAFNTGYTVTAKAGGPGGDVTASASFRTVKAKEELTASVLPLDGETVGVGLPIVVYLSEPVEDRAAVERRLRVETSRPVVGAWHWMSDDEVHFRPRDYWPAHTKITLRADLRGVKAGEGVWGVKDRLIEFDTGDAIISSVDIKKLKMTVSRNGKVVRRIPVTAGKDGFTTRSGIKVLSEKHRVKIMDAATIGIREGDPEYYRLRVEYALRVTNSGEFVHAAPWSVGSQGSSRVSHGCVGMSMANAKWLYGISHRGDIIKVTGTKRQIEPGNGFTDWNMSWKEWVDGSALA